MLQVYNPDEEELVIMYGAKEFPLKPKAVTALPNVVAKHAELTHGMWGVSIIYGPAKSDIESAIEKADSTYKAKTRSWAEERIVEHHKASKARLELGLQVDEPDEVSWAKAWLKREGFLT